MNPAVLARQLGITPQEAAALIEEQGLSGSFSRAQDQLDRAMEGPARRLPGPSQILDNAPGERFLDWAGEANPLGFLDDLVRQSGANEGAELLVPFADTLPAGRDLVEGWDDPVERDYQSARLGMSLATGLLDFMPGMGIADEALRVRPDIPRDFTYNPIDPESAPIALPDRSREVLNPRNAPADLPWNFNPRRVFDETGGFGPLAEDFSPALRNMYSPSARRLMEGDAPGRATGVEWSRYLDAAHRRGEGRLNNEARFTGLDQVLSEYADRTLGKDDILSTLAGGWQDAGRLRRSHERLWEDSQPPRELYAFSTQARPRPEGAQLITQSTENWGQTHWPDTPGGLMHYRSWNIPGEGRLVREIQADTLRQGRRGQNIPPEDAALFREYDQLQHELQSLESLLPEGSSTWLPFGMRQGETVREAFHRMGRETQEQQYPYFSGDENRMSQALSNPYLERYYDAMSRQQDLANEIYNYPPLHDAWSRWQRQPELPETQPLHTGSQDAATRFLVNRSILDALADEKRAVNFPSSWEQLGETHNLEPGITYASERDNNLLRSFTRHYGRDVPNSVNRAAQELGTEVQFRPSSGMNPAFMLENSRYFDKSPRHYSRRYGIDLNEDVLLNALARGLPAF